MNITRTAHVTRTKLAATTAVLAGLALTLSACGGVGGSDNDGTYLSTKSNDLTSVAIDGNEVTYTEMHCDESPDEAEASVGELNEDQTSITWIESGRFEGTDEVTITESAIDISGSDTFAREDLDAGKDVRERWQERCAQHNN